MKKNLMFAMFGAIALTGSVGLAACSSSEDVVDVNPTFDGEAVKTQFTISLPFNNAKTRQTYSIVQGAENITSFRGMSDIVLIPFQSAADRTTRLGSKIELRANTMIVPTTINTAYSIPSGELLVNSNAVLYNDVTIPVGTSGFLFYGKAPESADNEFEEGRLTAAGLTGETSGISFTPTPILTSSNVLDAETRTNIITYINSIAAATYNNNTPDNLGDDITWAACDNAGLRAMYDAFTSMRAGASSYVMAAVRDLYASIYQNTDVVSVAIRTAILNVNYASEGENPGTLNFTEKITGTDGLGFPAHNKMPEGAAALSWAANNLGILQASAADSNYGGPVDDPDDEDDEYVPTMNLINMTDIVYPASLYYYVNSSIQTSNTLRINDYNDIDAITDGQQLGTWTQILGKYTSGESVSSATRSVAIKDPIQYAVGRLDVTVSALGSAPHYDRKGEAVAFPTGTAAENQRFPLTGVLIGGQKAVGYQFTPTGSTEYTIYDKTIYSDTEAESPVYDYIASSTPAGPTYTLALETAPETSVYVALEFVNNANDFQGYDGVVKHGCKFYMIAKLDPTINVATGNNQVSGVTNTEKRVFMQDFKTIANFTFGAGSNVDANGDGISDAPGGFANAYTTIPDLRTPQLELGLSVDLAWQNGVQFDVTF